MKLIGMLDSPYVRRVAISLQLLELPFEHEALSVFRTFAQFQRINPVVRAPSLVCDDGTVLMDSSLILDYAQAIAHPRRLVPADLRQLAHALRVIGLALAACEKSVQIIYERRQRPPEKLHEPWLARLTDQLHAAYRGLEAEFAQRSPDPAAGNIDLAGVTAAVAWRFTQETQPGLVPPAQHPALAAFSAAAEALPQFLAAPFGEGTYRA